MIEDLFRTRAGVILVSIIWGFGLAALFRRVCKGRSCIIYKAPNPDWMKEQVVENEGSCFQMIPETSSCHLKNKNRAFNQ